LKAVESAIIYFKKVMINIPIEFGRNDDEIESFMEYFCKLGATPRFIESMSTKGYNAKKQGRLEDQISKRIKNIKKTGSYLWGIDTYEFDKFKFEILRCICFDNKCDICYKTNFIHLDKDFKIRPCNLRKKKIEVNSNNPKKSIIESIKFLSKQKCPPLEYNNLWNE
jgi:molybdenum cofactor biosynthesis enzyme MoaA